MFQTVRHWWSDGSGKVTLRLFLFELVVVVVGVLIAQGVASYVQDRSALSRMEAERSRIRVELADALSGLKSWRAAVPCLDQRMTEAMNGKQFGPNELSRPTFVGFDLAVPSTDTMELIARQYGMEEKIALNWMMDNVGSILPLSEVIRDKWVLVSLIDPVNGAPTDSDRTGARVAAAEIRARLRRIDSLAKDVEPLFQKLGIRSQELYTPDRGPAKSCAAIWKSGWMNPPLTMR